MVLVIGLVGGLLLAAGLVGVLLYRSLKLPRFIFPDSLDLFCFCYVFFCLCVCMCVCLSKEGGMCVCRCVVVDDLRGQSNVLPRLYSVIEGEGKLARRTIRERERKNIKESE